MPPAVSCRRTARRACRARRRSAPPSRGTCWLVLAHLRPRPVGTAGRDGELHVSSAPSSQGSKAWSWNITPRSRLGPRPRRPSMMTVPSLAGSEAREDVEDGRLAATGVADDANEFAFVDAEGDVLEHGQRRRPGPRIALGQALVLRERRSWAHSDVGDEALQPAEQRGPAPCQRCRSSGSRQITPAIDRLFHSFQT